MEVIFYQEYVQIKNVRRRHDHVRSSRADVRLVQIKVREAMYNSGKGIEFVPD